MNRFKQPRPCLKEPPLRTAALLLAMLFAIIIPFCLFGSLINVWTDQLVSQASEHPMRTGLLLILLLSVDIVMPVPSSLVSTACGMTLGFAGGTLASFLGMTVSTAAGYLMGHCASPAVAKKIGEKELAWLKTFQRRHGAWMILALRPVPVLAEASILFSGLSGQPLPGVITAASLGNIVVSLAYAAIGTWGRLSDSFLPAFGASLALSGVCILVLRLRRPRRPCPVLK